MSNSVVPKGVKWASPVCANCGHLDPHWIAAGQDICTHDGHCDCEHYVARFDVVTEVAGPSIFVQDIHIKDVH